MKKLETSRIGRWYDGTRAAFTFTVFDNHCAAVCVLLRNSKEGEAVCAEIRGVFASASLPVMKKLEKNTIKGFTGDSCFGIIAFSLEGAKKHSAERQILTRGGAVW